MTKHGFRLVTGGRPKKKIHARHGKELIRHKSETSRYLKMIGKVSGLIPDNLYIPYPAEDLFWALYQKK